MGGSMEGGAAGEAGAGTGGSVSLGGSAGSTSGSGGTAGGASGGGAGGAPATCQDGATRPCCQDGRQACSSGVWSACTGARISEETCNGVDDDCNGLVDDLGTFSCGAGACVTTVVACGPSGINLCVPRAPTTNVDGCDGIDNDCDGAVDEDCASCVRVAPNGDDTAASGDANATPFATVQAAIDYAAAHPGGPARVCVAGGATCQDSATYSGPSSADLTMRDGIDVLANYEATTWTRCAAFNTHLTPQTAAGIVFPAAVTSPTTLDGFSIDRYTAGTSTAAVTVDGATNVVLSNLVLPANATIDNAYGIVLQNGAEALVLRSRIEVGFGRSEVIGIKATDSRLYLEDSSGADNNGASPPCKTTGNGVVIGGESLRSATRVRGILLENSPGSLIEDSDVCASFSDALYAIGRQAVVEIHGDATGSMLRHDHLMGRPLGQQISSLAATDCAGATPWIVDNTLSVVGLGQSTAPDVVYAAGDCHPLIDSNPWITATMPQNSGAVAVHCGSLGGVDSRCIVSENANVGSNIPSYTAGAQASGSGTGVQCDGASCARIDHNSVWGLAPPSGAMSCAVRMDGTGLVLNQSPALVAANYVVGMSGLAPASTGLGISSSGAARIENNFVYGLYASVGPSSCGGVVSSIGLFVTGAVDVDSNYISGRPGVSCTISSSGLGTTAQVGYGVYAGPGGTFRNNVMEGCASFQESGADGDPLVFEDNSLPNGYLDETATYPNVDFSDPRLSATQVNALGDMTTSGNIAATCFTNSGGILHLAADSACIDAGTATGAPSVDYDGQARGAAPDIGPDEYVH